MKRFSFACLLVLLCGCAHLPKSTVPLCVLNPAESSEAIMQRTRNVSAPAKYTVVTSAVFSFFGKNIPIIGMMTIDEKAQTFAIAGYNHVGVKLIEVEGDAKSEKARFVMPELAKFGNVSKAVAEVVRAVYFDRIPTVDSYEHWRESDRVVFEQRKILGDLRWTVGGNPLSVIEKTMFKKNKMRWRVIYIEYDRSHQRVVPTKIEIINKAYHYRLKVTVKEIRA